MTRLVHQDEERRSHQQFATRHADERYQPLLLRLHDCWGRWNEGYFGRGLEPPHIAFDLTAARSLGNCAAHTGYGGRLQITLNAGLAFGTNEDWVVRPGGQGHERLLDDLLLRYTVRQFVLEALQAQERGHRGYGPLFAREANRIGQALGLNPVVPRRRRAGDAGAAVCLHWPHCVRPLDYYGDDVTAELLALARGGSGGGYERGGAEGASLGCLALVQFFADGGRAEVLGQVVRRHAERLTRLQQERWPAPRKVEAGEQDVDGSPLGDVGFEPGWLEGNDGLVRRMVEAIGAAGSLGEVPLLADALEEAGCQEERVLRHLRADMEHSRRCWVLAGLREAMGGHRRHEGHGETGTVSG